MRTRQQLVGCFAIGFLVAALLSVAHARGMLREAQESLDDSLIFQTRSGQAHTVALVHIDERTAAALRDQHGRVGTWPRSLHARVLRALSDAGARVVAFDLIFDAPGCPDTAPRPCADDTELAEAIRYARGRRNGGMPVLLAASGAITRTEPDQVGRAATYSEAILPHAQLAVAATAIGHAHAATDTRGVTRWIPLTARLGSQDYPALSFLTAAAFLRQEAPLVPPTATKAVMGERHIPLEEHGKVRVNFLGPPSDVPAAHVRTRGGGTPPVVPVVSFLDVLEGRLDSAVVANKAVFIGVAAYGFNDDSVVPTSRGWRMSGVEIHAQATEMFLRAAFLTPQGTASLVPVLFLVTLATAWVAGRLHALLSAFLCVVMVALYLIVALVVSSRSEAGQSESVTFVLLNTVYPMLGIGITYVATLMYRSTWVLVPSPPRARVPGGTSRWPGGGRVRFGSERRRSLTETSGG